jgi:ribonucleotide reductase beta subunit family protein with ferritin-like domain
MLDALPNKLLGMNIDLMTSHIQYVANRLAKQLGCSEIYPEVKQPFTFMTNISISTVADFFGPSKETQYNIGDKFMGVPFVLMDTDEF